MDLLGKIFGSKKKIEFDAMQGRNEFTKDLYDNPQSYSFVHNYKVHFKRGGLQVLADKIDVSINSGSPKLPSMQEVTEEFNNRMSMTVAHSNTRRRFSLASYHITNIEYKESMAIFLQQEYQNVPQRLVPQSSPISAMQEPQSTFCRNCGSKFAPDSKFCSKCGTPARATFQNVIKLKSGLPKE